MFASSGNFVFFLCTGIFYLTVCNKSKFNVATSHNSTSKFTAFDNSIFQEDACLMGVISRFENCPSIPPIFTSVQHDSILMKLSDGRMWYVKPIGGFRANFVEKLLQIFDIPTPVPLCVTGHHLDDSFYQFRPKTTFIPIRNKLGKWACEFQLVNQILQGNKINMWKLGAFGVSDLNLENVFIKNCSDSYKTLAFFDIDGVARLPGLEYPPIELYWNEVVKTFTEMPQNIYDFPLNLTFENIQLQDNIFHIISSHRRGLQVKQGDMDVMELKQIYNSIRKVDRTWFDRESMYELSVWFDASEFHNARIELATYFYLLHDNFDISHSTIEKLFVEFNNRWKNMKDFINNFLSNDDMNTCHLSSILMEDIGWVVSKEQNVMFVIDYDERDDYMLRRRGTIEYALLS